MPMKPWQKTLIAASIVLYGAGLSYPESFCIGSSCDDWPGWGILIFGWLAVFASPANMIWLANLVLFVCWVLQFNSVWIPSLVAGLAALGWGASFLLHDQVLSSESGSLSSITGTAPGYWLWLTSMAVACVNAGLSLRRRS